MDIVQKLWEGIISLCILALILNTLLLSTADF